MFNILSFLIGLIAAAFALVGILPIPLLPLVNWIALPIAVLGVIVGLLSSGTAGRNLNILIIIIAGARLLLTGGLI
jgi:hypothetical protein